MAIISQTIDNLLINSIILCENCEGSGLIYIFDCKADCNELCTCGHCGGAGRVKIKFEKLPGFEISEGK